MTIQEKLKMFHDKRVGILVDSEEKAQELARVLDEGDFEDSEWFTWERVIGTAWDRYGDTHELYVSYNHSSIDSHSISIPPCFSKKNPNPSGEERDFPPCFLLMSLL
jgi:hypothetical protein